MLPGISCAMLLGAGVSYEVTFCGFFEVAVKSATGSASIDIGAAHADREIFLVCTTADSTATLTAASTTVNSVAVTKASSEFSTASADPCTQSCAFAAVPSGSGSVTVDVTYSGITGGALISVYRVVGRPGKGNNQTDASNGTTASGTTVTVSGTTINAGGLWFGACNIVNAASVPTPPTGTTADVDDSPGSTWRYQTCSRAIQANSTTPTDVWTTSGTSTQMAASTWAFA